MGTQNYPLIITKYPPDLFHWFYPNWTPWALRNSWTVCSAFLGRAARGSEQGLTSAFITSWVKVPQIQMQCLDITSSVNLVLPSDHMTSSETGTALVNITILWRISHHILWLKSNIYLRESWRWDWESIVRLKRCCRWKALACCWGWRTSLRSCTRHARCWNVHPSPRSQCPLLKLQ